MQKDTFITKKSHVREVIGKCQIETHLKLVRTPLNNLLWKSKLFKGVRTSFKDIPGFSQPLKCHLNQIFLFSYFHLY